MVAGAITGGEVTVNDCRPEHLTALLEALQAAGVKVQTQKNSIFVQAGDGLKAHSIATAPHPGYATDLQAQFMTLMTQAEGSCTISENVFENRFMHVQELARMNAKIEISGRQATVHGQPGKLTGAPVMATDLRASASLVLAGLVANGVTTVQRIYHLDRGYERLELKLSKIGGNVRRVSES